MTQQTLRPERPRVTRLRLGMLVCGLGVAIVAAAARYYWGLSPASAGSPRTRTASPTKAPDRPTEAPAVATPTQQKIVATVNGERISREDLARDCLRRHGKEVLERLVNKYLITQECARRNIEVTPSEVNAELERLAGRFGWPTDQWLKMLQKERGITPEQYANDIIWPTLAMRKLAGERLKVSDAEIQEEYEKCYGAAVKARLIVCPNREQAESVREKAAANPESFGDLAKQYSTDPSASLKGLIHPIRQHMGDEQIEQVAFNMKDGEVSPVISVANQCAIIKREGLVEARDVPLNEQLRGSLEEIIRERKLEHVATGVFAEMQKDAQVVNVFNDPSKAREMPGVAAVINGQQITLRELAESCIDRNGRQVLQEVIHRRLLEQACKKANITVTDADLDAEIARAAALSYPANADGSPNVKGWLNMITEQQGISLESYRHDSVWPSVALKKLVGMKIEVTQEDLKKGFEANYGPRVRCRAIIMDNLRRAQQVWDMARKGIDGKPMEQAEARFADLAEQYSTEPASRALRGEVPPIQRHGGQPVMEKEAFELKRGELSSLIQVDSRYVILFCLGQTDPVEVDFASVRDLIYQDIHEKKLRLAMAEGFEQLQQQATVDNYLEGSSHTPKSAARPPEMPPSAPVTR